MFVFYARASDEKQKEKEASFCNFDFPKGSRGFPQSKPGKFKPWYNFLVQAVVVDINLKYRKVSMMAQAVGNPEKLSNVTINIGK